MIGSSVDINSRGRGIRGQRGGRGRGEVEGLRGLRERSLSKERSRRWRPSEFGLAEGAREWDGHGKSARGQGNRGGRGRGRGREDVENLGEMCNKISEVMKERLESVVGNTKEELQTNMRSGMSLLVDAVEEVMGKHLDRVKAVEETMSRISESLRQESSGRREMEKRAEVRLAEVEGRLQDVRAEVGKENNETRNMEKRTEVRLAEVEDKVQDVWTEVGKENSERRDMEKKTGEIIAEIENKVKEVRAVVDKIRIGESVKEMEAKVRRSMCMVKVNNIDTGLITDNKATIVRMVLGEVRKRTRTEETEQVNRILRRTRVVVLGKRTERREYRGRTECTVPMLRALRSLSQGAPSLSKSRFAQERRAKERFQRAMCPALMKMGATEQNSYVRIRPEVREGSILLRADVKPKTGGRFVMKGIWVCPPLHRMLWGVVEGLYTPQAVGKG